MRKEKDGTGIYTVTFKVGGQKYKYRIDTMTGEIFDKSVKEDNEITRLPSLLLNESESDEGFIG